MCKAQKAAFAAHAAARETKRLLQQFKQTRQAVATTHMFGHAIHASTYAVKSVTYATNFDVIAVANERTWQYQYLLDL